jgi:hypothetical protein
MLGCEFTTPSELAPPFVEAPTGTCTKPFLEINSFPFLEILCQHMITTMSLMDYSHGEDTFMEEIFFSIIVRGDNSSIFV